MLSIVKWNCSVNLTYCYASKTCITLGIEQLQVVTIFSSLLGTISNVQLGLIIKYCFLLYHWCEVQAVENGNPEGSDNIESSVDSSMDHISISQK